MTTCCFIMNVGDMHKTPPYVPLICDQVRLDMIVHLRDWSKKDQTTLFFVQGPDICCAAYRLHGGGLRLG